MERFVSQLHRRQPILSKYTHHSTLTLHGDLGCCTAKMCVRESLDVHLVSDNAILFIKEGVQSVIVIQEECMASVCPVGGINIQQKGIIIASLLVLLGPC